MDDTVQRGAIQFLRTTGHVNSMDAVLHARRGADIAHNRRAASGGVTALIDHPCRRYLVHDETGVRLVSALPRCSRAESSRDVCRCSVGPFTRHPELTNNSPRREFWRYAGKKCAGAGTDGGGPADNLHAA